MKDPVTYFFSTLHLRDKAALFKKLLYIFLLLKCIYWFINYKFLFGENSVISDKEFEIGFVKGAAFFLYDRPHQWLCTWAIVLTMLMSVLSLLRLHIYFIFDFICWIIILNLHNRVYPTLTAGDFLLNQLLLFNCFIISNNNNASPLWSQLKTCLHNFAILAVIIQVCLLYFSSGVTKLLDSSWLSGEAISITSQVDHFNLFHPVRFKSYSFISRITDYIVMAYQLLFPVLIWFKNIKKPLLIMGVCIHLYIAFIIGLVSFGLLMLIPYVLFWPKRSLDKA